MRKHPNSHREAKATAPVLDSTLHSTQNAPDFNNRQPIIFDEMCRMPRNF